MRQLESKRYFRDKVLICCDCQRSFTWTAGEQRYYHTKELAEPRRCPACRERRKRTLIPNWREYTKQ